MADLQDLIKKIIETGIPASTLSDESSPCVVAGFLSTGCYVLDAIMGGGLPLGRVVEIYGDTSTGKSLIASQACAAIQDEGGMAVYIDTETAVSLPIMEAVGVDVDNLVYTAPDTVEQVFKVMETSITSKPDDVDLLIIWDSIAATSAAAEMDKATGEVGYMTHARVISQGLRKLTRMISKKEVSCLFLNQAKQNIGVMWGDKVATFGGKAVGFHSSVRVQMRASKKIQGKKKRIIGINVIAKVTKNKIAPPFREAVLPIYFGHGIDEELAALAFLRTAGLIISSGSSNRFAAGNFSISGLAFTKAKWIDVFDEYYDEICSLIDNALRGGDLV
jgi:recombination protein RecA